MIIIGVDPGTLKTGYGIIKVSNGEFITIDYGCIKPPANYLLSDRYLIIFNALEELLDRYNPDRFVIETQYVDKNVQSAIKLGMARGIALITAKKRGIEVFELSPTKAKKAVTGKGSATKFEVQKMIQLLLKLKSLPEPDAADALSLAIALANSSKNCFSSL